MRTSQIPTPRVFGIGMVVLASVLMLQGTREAFAFMPCCQALDELRDACYYECENNECTDTPCENACKAVCDYMHDNTNCEGPGGGCDTYEPQGWENLLDQCTPSWQSSYQAHFWTCYPE
jgi:hypothetical protein